jgi:Sec-independent protein translocase protein TatA
MSFMGLGGFEILLIGAIALFVLGPKRLLQGIRDGRKVYSDLKRQRDTLQSMITEAIDLEDLKKQIDVDGMKDTVKKLEDDLGLDEVAEDVRRANSVVSESVPRDWQFNRPPIEVDSEVRDAIPDLDISGNASGDAPKKAGPVGSSGESDSTPVSESETETGVDADVDEVKS